MKKLITEVSDSELLELLKDSPNIKEESYKNDILDFVSAYQFKHGSHLVKSSLLYKLYKQWSKSPISTMAFNQEFTEMFAPTYRGSYRYYSLNVNPVDLKTSVYQYLKPISKNKRKHWMDHFNNFIIKYNIKKGGFYILDKVLYNLYDSWTYKNRKANPLGFCQFQQHCQANFKVKLINKKEWYGVDRSIKQYLTPVLIEVMKKAKK